MIKNNIFQSVAEMERGQQTINNSVLIIKTSLVEQQRGGGNCWLIICLPLSFNNYKLQKEEAFFTIFGVKINLQTIVPSYLSFLVDPCNDVLLDLLPGVQEALRVSSLVVVHVGTVRGSLYIDRRCSLIQILNIYIYIFFQFAFFTKTYHSTYLVKLISS